MDIRIALEFTEGHVHAAAALLASAGKRTFSERGEEGEDRPSPPQRALLELPSFTGVPDIDRAILLELDDYSVAQACQVSRAVRAICETADFWRLRLEKYFPDAPFDPLWTAAQAKRFYLAVRVYHNLSPRETSFTLSSADIDNDPEMLSVFLDYIIPKGYIPGDDDRKWIYKHDMADVLERLWLPLQSRFMGHALSLDEANYMVKHNATKILDFVAANSDRNFVRAIPRNIKATAITPLIRDQKYDMLSKIKSLGYSWKSVHLMNMMGMMDLQLFEVMDVPFDYPEWKRLVTEPFRNWPSKYVSNLGQFQLVKPESDEYFSFIKEIMDRVPSEFWKPFYLLKAALQNKKDVAQWIMTLPGDYEMDVIKKSFKVVVPERDLVRDAGFYYDLFGIED